MKKQDNRYGFIYIWYDKKHKRYYIGSHWGTVDDGYICSSHWMRKSYRRRPSDFKRRIIKYVYDRSELIKEEFRYLHMIKKEEIGKRYYNLQIHWEHWSHDENSRLTVGQKISKKLKARPFVRNEGHFKKGVIPSNAFEIGHIPANKGKSLTEFFGEEKALEIKQKMSNKKKGKIFGQPFKKGHEPIQKGKTWEEIYGFEKAKEAKLKLSNKKKGKIPANAFKKGQLPKNAQKIKTPHGIFPSIAEASRSLELKPWVIEKNLKNEKNSEWQRLI